MGVRLHVVTSSPVQGSADCGCRRSRTSALLESGASCGAAAEPKWNPTAKPASRQNAASRTANVLVKKILIACPSISGNSL
jgi:hypothetical protein